MTATSEVSLSNTSQRFINPGARDSTLKDVYLSGGLKFRDLMRVRLQVYLLGPRSMRP